MFRYSCFWQKTDIHVNVFSPNTKQIFVHHVTLHVDPYILTHVRTIQNSFRIPYSFF
jgi:hypothetical protein